MDRCACASDTFYMNDTEVQLTKQERRRMRKAKKEQKNHHDRDDVVVPFKRNLDTTKLEAKTPKQKLYINMIKTKQQIIATGCAGTGKTYIPTVIALDMLLQKKISKIIITRPNVASGNSIGFFPGTLEEKMAPWAVPIVSTIKERIGQPHLENLIKNEAIEIVPFEVMRGRTFKNAFVILDEAQNCTFEELKMFVTRIGDESKVFINGDIYQTDLKKTSGLKKLLFIAATYNLDVGRIEFTSEDVVRSGICKDWVMAFEGENKNED